MPSLNATIDRKKHPDGVHRYHKRWQLTLYQIPGEPNLLRCYLCGKEVDGWPYQRTTTFIDVLEGKFTLEKWKMRQVIRGLMLKEALQVKASSAFDSDAELDDIAERALEAADSAKGADMGSGVHDVTERIDRGDSDVIVHPSIKPVVEAYRELVEAERLTIREIECHIAVDGVATTKTARGISGTFDRIVEVSEVCPVCGTNRRVLDLKTTKPTSFPYDFRKIPMQLACYASGVRYDANTGERTPLNVCQCTGLVVHLPLTEDKPYAAALYLADLTSGRRGLVLAHEVWNWRGLDGLMIRAPERRPDTATSTSPGPSGTPPVPGGPDIFGLITVAADRDNLLGLRNHFMAEGLWTAEHDQAAKRRVEELQAQGASNG